MEVIYSSDRGQGVIKDDGGFDLEKGEAQLPQHHGNETDSNRPAGRKQLSMVSEQTYLEKITALLALAAFASSIAAMVMVGGTIVKTSSVLIYLLSPYSYFQQTRITDIRALKETNAALTGEVNQLAIENDNLNVAVGRLGESVGKLEDIETVMQAITETQGQSVESLKATVEDNRRNTERMETNIQASVLQNILSVVFSSDANGDYNLSDKETSTLIRSLRDVNGVQVDEKRFREVVKDKKGSVEGVVEILKDLLDEDSNSENAVFSFD
jgi:hypothetical protein